MNYSYKRNGQTVMYGIQCHEIFCFYDSFKFFQKLMEIFASQGAPPVSTTPVANLPPVSTTPMANFDNSFDSVVDNSGKFATGVNDTSGKFAVGVNNTGWQFATSINDTGSKFCHQSESQRLPTRPVGELAFESLKENLASRRVGNSPTRLGEESSIPRLGESESRRLPDTASRRVINSLTR